MLVNSKLYAESWNVAWRKKPKGSILTDTDTEFIVINNQFRFWAADPFVFEKNNETYIFAELYDYVSRKGIIGYYSLSGKKWVPIIREKYHMSYPCIFEQNGEIFLLPETSTSSCLYIYRAEQFPDRWEKYRILRSNVKYVDTTPFHWNKKKYLLAYDISDPQISRLVLLDLKEKNKDKFITADRLGVRRPAGNFFQMNSKLYRPAQNCMEDYGKGLIFYSCEMKDDVYCETVEKKMSVTELNYSKKLYLDGMHTYNSNHQYEVIDIKTRRFNLINLCSRLFGKLKGIIR